MAGFFKKLFGGTEQEAKPAAAKTGAKPTKKAKSTVKVAKKVSTKKKGCCK